MSHERILIVDDEPSARSGLEKLLRLAGYETTTAEDGAKALDLATESPPDLVITDLDMPVMDGMAFMAALTKAGIESPVIVMTGTSEISAAVAAMRAGASEFLTKPIDFDVLSVAIERALERRQLHVETENLRRQIRDVSGSGLQGLLGTSPAMQKIYRVARQVASSRATLLITGESGTGKGELAKAVHALGPRADKPFVSLHCAAIPETLLESELFGHEKGSFTGADRRRAGRFEQASGGTLFLDEVGEIPPGMQVKLLRVLQERVIERVGGNETIAVDVRVIAATNRDLAKDVQDGRFREDLYYRLNVVRVEMPPLRARGGDVLLLANHFLEHFAKESARAISGFTDAAREKILSLAWPGNVRELENAIERAVVMCEGERIDARDLPFDAFAARDGAVRIPGSTMAELERHAILATLASVGGSTTRAAEVLQISVRTIQYRLAEYRRDRRIPNAAVTTAAAE